MGSKTSETSSAFTLEALEKLSKPQMGIQRQISRIARIQQHTKPSINDQGLQTAQSKNKIALQTFEASVGGRQALIEALEFATLDAKEEQFLRLLSDPAFNDKPLSKLARLVKLEPAQLLVLFHTAIAARTQAIVMGKITTALPRVVDDMVEKAVDAEIMCPECFGAENLDGSPCLRCYGRGTIMRYSTIDHQKLLLEAGSVIKRGGNGVNVQLNQNINSNNQPGSFFSRFVQNSDKAAYSVIDAEPVGESDDPTSE